MLGGRRPGMPGEPSSDGPEHGQVNRPERSPSGPWYGPRASFRDPDGQVILLDDRVLRLVHPDAVELVEDLLASPILDRLEADGHLVGTQALEGDAETSALRSIGARQGSAPGSHHRPLQGAKVGCVLEHERIPFPSYPHEWPAEMLHAASQLTLDLALTLADEGLGLKDATPYNVMFQGPDPVFIDLLSIEDRDPHDPTWLPQAQFVRTSILPLYLHRDIGLEPADLLLTHRDGIQPSDAYRMIGPIRRLLPPYLGLVTLPTWLGGETGEKMAETHQDREVDDPEKARFIYERQLKKLASRVEKVRPVKAKQGSHWADYMETSEYDRSALEAKETFVTDALDRTDPGWVLDVGCNTGHFSELAARAGSTVVAIDYDPAVVGLTWQRARQEDLEILPLVVDLARPPPAVGWANAEAPAFLDRAEARFDTVLMLALVHHLLVTERVPLERIIDMAAWLTRDQVIVEHVGREDPMFQRLLRGRDELHEDHTRKAFEAACQTRFTIEDDTEVPGLDRHLYLLSLDDQGPSTGGPSTGEQTPSSQRPRGG